MAVDAWDSTIFGLEGESWSIGTTTTYLALLPNFREVKCYCAADWRLGLCPKLVHAVFYNATAGTYTEYVQSVTDRSTSTHLPLDAMIATDILYLGTSDQVAGFKIDLNATNKNANAATLDWEYCSTAGVVGTDPTFTDVAGDSDGTASGGATLAQDGVYSFTLPACVRSVLRSAPNTTMCYWYRFKPSTTLSATIDVEEITPIPRNTNYGYMTSGIEYNIHLDLAHVGGLVANHATTSATVYVSWIR
jgi:hypothetical protein